jgi:hypothetical protein
MMRLGTPIGQVITAPNIILRDVFLYLLCTANMSIVEAANFEDILASIGSF